MNKPPTDPGDWSSDAEALFDSARGAYTATAADRERVRSALAQKAAASGARDAGVHPRSLGTLAKLGLGLGGVLLGIAALQLREAPEREREQRAAQQVSSPVAMPAPHAAKPEAPDSVAPLATAAVTVPATTPANRATPASSARPGDSRADRTLAARPVADLPKDRHRVEASSPAKALVYARAPDRSQPRAVEPIASVRAQSPAPTQREAPAQSTDARAELDFVARINAAARNASPQAVLALCAEHERRWPHGMFEQEREGTRAIALCSSNANSAGARARGFLDAYPRAAIAARVRQECAAWLAPDPEDERP